MKKWKTLKVLLGVLCAMVAAIGLFACKNGGGSDIANITRTQGASDLSFTDNDQWNNIVSSLETKVKLTCKPTKGETFQVEGKDCNFTSTIEFDEANHCKIGLYTIKIQPKAKNPKNRYSEVNVEIVHAFEEEGEREVCSYCKATKTSSEEDTILHFGSFHSHGSTYTGVSDKVYGDDGTNGAAYTNKKATSYIEQFGTVKATGGATYTIPTLTVGRLEPGMTITVKGTAKTAWSQWKEATGTPEKDAGYYFPVIGIADRFLSDPVWEGEKRTDYVGGGTSVMVRGEGWVLYNGIDSSHTDSDVVRMLGGLASTNNGQGTGRNYASHDQAEQASDEKRPSGYVQGQIPPANEWADWVVYSTGTYSNSGAYSEEVEIELTWNYREDGVVEIIYNVEGAKLVAMVKVPEASMGYYDTILHGDYVNMHITSYERIETRTPSDFIVESVTLKNYYEGEMFDPTTVSAKFKYEQTGDQLHTQALSLENFYASENPNADPANASDWVSLKDNSMSASYEVYKAEIVKGAKTWRDTFTKDKVKVVENVIESVYGADCDKFDNNNTVGELTIGTDGTNITLTPKGTVYVQAIPGDATMTGTIEASHRYVALNVKASAALGATITAKNAEGDDTVPFYYNSGDGHLVLALTSTVNKVEVTGLQKTPTIFDFSGAKGFNVESSISGLTGWQINNDSNEVIITFKAVNDTTFTEVQIGAATRTLEQLKTMTENFTRRDQFTLYKEGTGVAEDGTVTLKIAFAKAQLNSEDSSRTVSAVVNGVTDFVYKIDYKPAFVDNDTIDMGYYNYVSSNKIYLAKLASDIENGEDALTLNVNEGNDNIALIDLSYRYANGKASFKSTSLKGAEISIVKIGGEDLVLIEVDPTAYDVSATKFGYQIKTNKFSTNYYAVVNNVVEKQTRDSDAEKLVVNEGTCLVEGLAGSLNKATVNSQEVRFLTDIDLIGGDHHWPNGNDGSFCTLCGAKHERTRTFPATTKLENNQYIQLNGTYGAHTEAKEHNRLTLKITVGNDFYWVRSDALVGKNGYTHSDAEEIWHSYTPNGEEVNLRTPNGKLSLIDGQEIDTSSFIAAMSEGSFFCFVSYENGVITVTEQLYVKGNNTTPLTEWTTKISGVTTKEISVTYSFDTNGFKGTMISGSGNIWYVKSDIVKSSVSEIDTTENVTVNGEVFNGNSGTTYTVGNVENSLINVRGSGKAVKLSEDQKTALGTELDYYIAFTVKMNKTLANMQAVNVKDANGNVIAKAVAQWNGDDLEVVIPTDGSIGQYVLDFVTSDASSFQGDIALDLSNIVASTVEETVTGLDSLNLITGGELTVTYTGLNTEATIKIGEDEADFGTLAQDTVLADIFKVKSKEGNAVTFTVSAPDLTAPLKLYTIELLSKDGKLLSSVDVDLTNIPASSAHGVKIDETTYVNAEGNKLTFVLLGGVSGDNTLTLNANSGAAIGAENLALIQAYDLTYTINANGVAFKANDNLLTKDAEIYLSNVNGKNVVVAVIDLTAMKITESGVYAFEVPSKNAAPETATTVYKVATDRAITSESLNIGARSEVIAATCLVDGVAAQTVTESDAVIFYFNTEVLPATGHSFPENGGLCERCGEVTGWVKEGIQVGAKNNSSALTVQNGTNLAYNPAITDRYSTVLPGQKVVAEGTITTNSSPSAWHGVAALLYPADNYVATTHMRIDRWIDKAGGASGTLADYNLEFAGDAGDFDNNGPAKENGNITITWDWSDTSKIVVKFEVWKADDESVYFWSSYTFTPVSGKQFAPQYSIGIAPDHGHFEGKITATASKDVVPAANCNPVKHEHTYDPTTDICWCGVQNPNHVHAYDATTHKCPIEGAINPDASVHTDLTNGVCNVCGAYIFNTDTHSGVSGAKVTVTNGDKTEGFWNGLGGSWTLPAGDFALRLTYTQDTAYSDNSQGAVLRFHGGKELVNIRFFTYNAGGNLDCWGDSWNQNDVTVQLSNGTTTWTGISDVKAHLPTGFTGSYEVLAYRIGNSLKVICNYTAADSTVWTITYSWASFEAGVTLTSIDLDGDTSKLSTQLDGYFASLTAKE